MFDRVIPMAPCWRAFRKDLETREIEGQGGRPEKLLNSAYVDCLKSFEEHMFYDS
jgi:hypothetical protein